MVTNRSVYRATPIYGRGGNANNRPQRPVPDNPPPPTYTCHRCGQKGILNLFNFIRSMLVYEEKLTRKARSLDSRVPNE